MACKRSGVQVPYPPPPSRLRAAFFMRGASGWDLNTNPRGGPCELAAQLGSNHLENQLRSPLAGDGSGDFSPQESGGLHQTSQYGIAQIRLRVGLQRHEQL
jgi:hypothetical protein